MSEIKWTDAQRDAIDARDGTVLVSAAAGSGKTAVLVNRVIEMITDEKNPFDVDELLIVTFTKAAAAQMRDKISRAIEKKISATKAPELRNRLFRQQMVLPIAKICTIDSFCGDVVRKNFQNIDIGIDYKMLNPDVEKSYRSIAYNETIEKYYEKNTDEFNSLSSMFTSGSDDGSLEELVMNLYDFSCSYPFPEKWISEIQKKTGNEITDSKNEFVMIILDYVISTVKYCIALSEEGMKAANNSGFLSQAYGSIMLNDLEFFKRTAETAEKVKADEVKWDDFCTMISDCKFETMRAPKGTSDEPETIYCKTVRDRYKKVYDEKIRAIMTITSDENKDDVKSIKPVIKTLAELTIDFMKAFDEMKRKDNCADFSDILHMALNILVEEKEGEYFRTKAAEEYSNEFKAILIDEYQDTNEAQDRLFWAVSNEGNNLFYVGDVKQSIYGFRQAMPQIFLGKRNSFQPYDRKKKIYPASINLDKNFRSRKGITDFINFTFEQIMSVDTGEIEYNSYEKLDPGAEYPEKEGKDVCLHIIDFENSINDIDKAEAQAVHISRRIKKMIENGETVLKDGEMRTVEFSDFGVLLRTKKDIAKFVDVLSKNGVNAYADESGNLFKEPEVRTVVSMLKIIDNPVYDIPLISVLLSPLAGFTVDEVSEIRAESQKGNFYSALRNAADNGNEKCCKFFSLLDEYRILASTLTPGKLIREILSQSGYDSFVSSTKDGKLKKENLEILQKYADDFSKENDIGLSEFVRLLDKLCESGTVKSAARSDGAGNAVAVMTIHHSKGLEFPVCFLAECEKNFNKLSLRENLIAHSQVGVGIIGCDSKKRIKYETISHQAVKIAKEKSEMSEELRVLYVAMTRAKEKMIMVTSLKNTSRTIEKLSINLYGKHINPISVRNSASYSDMILLSVLRYPGQDVLRSPFNYTAVKYDENDVSPLEVEIIDADTLEYEEEKTVEEKVQPDKKLVEEIAEKSQYIYPYSDLSGIPAKRSASQVNGNGISRDFFASSRPAFMDENGLTPAQKGTAMHLFMQHSDYHNARNDVESEIARLTSEGFISTQQSESLDRQKLKGFFTSSVAERMLSSNRVYREKKFIINMSVCEFDNNLPEKFENERVVVQGILDCAFEEDGKIVIVDYKTDRVSSKQQLAERYRPQLNVYKKAVRECLGYEIKQTVLYSFYLGKEVVL